jgi:type I restriction enzyme S subunit
MNDLSILLPTEWKIVHLGSKEPLICDQIKNGTTINQNKNKKGLKVTRIETISNSFIDDNIVGYTTEATPKILNDYLIKKGDILFSHINSDAHIGKSAIAKKDYDDLIHGMNLLLIRPNKQNTIPEYINYVFIYFRAIGFFKKICKRAVNQSSINQANLKTIEMPLPSIPEQCKISAVLSTVQKAVEIQTKLIERTIELKKAMMQKLFKEGTRGEKQKMTEIGPMPESWKVLELKRILNTTLKVNLKEERNKIIKYIDVSSISRNRLRIKSTIKYILKNAPGRARKKVFLGDVIFATVRPTLKRIAYIDENYDNQVCSTAFCVLHGNNEKSRKFIYYLVQRENFIKQIAFIQSGVSYPAVTDRQVKSQLIPLPSIEEQIEIANHLMVIDKKIELHNNKKQKLEELFRTLLHQLMTAEIRVNDIDLDFLEEVS